MIYNLIIFIAKKFRISPFFFFSHILLLLAVTILYAIFNPSGWIVFYDPTFLKIWFGICVIVIFIQWILQGKNRKEWMKKIRNNEDDVF